MKRAAGTTMTTRMVRGEDREDDRVSHRSRVRVLVLAGRCGGAARRAAVRAAESVRGAQEDGVHRAGREPRGVRGVGLALYVAALAGVGGWGGAHQIAVLAFAALAGLGISVLSKRQGTDTAIGIVLAVCMAVGFELYRLAAGVAARDPAVGAPPGIEDVLFGSVLNVTPGAAVATGLAAAIELGGLWWIRRPLTAWAFDEQTAGSLGVSGGRVRALLLLMLSVAVVATMQIAGVVLATAMLIVPGVAGLSMGRSLRGAIGWSVVSAVLGVAFGLVVTFEFGVQPGPSVVLVLVALMVAGRLVGRG